LKNNLPFAQISSDLIKAFENHRNGGRPLSDDTRDKIAQLLTALINNSDTDLEWQQAAALINAIKHGGFAALVQKVISDKTLISRAKQKRFLKALRANGTHSLGGQREKDPFVRRGRSKPIPHI